jgi:hypothetical protein
MRTWNLIIVALLALISCAFAQDSNDAITGGAVQEQIGTMGQQLKQSAVQHIVEGNLTGEHISREFNESLNRTSEQIQQKATEELKRQVSQQVPGFESLIALIGLLGAILIRAKRN